MSCAAEDLCVRHVSYHWPVPQQSTTMELKAQKTCRKWELSRNCDDDVRTNTVISVTHRWRVWSGRVIQVTPMTHVRRADVWGLPRTICYQVPRRLSHSVTQTVTTCHADWHILSCLSHRLSRSVTQTVTSCHADCHDLPCRLSCSVMQTVTSCHTDRHILSCCQPSSWSQGHPEEVEDWASWSRGSSMSERRWQ